MKHAQGEIEPSLIETLKEAYNQDANSFAESCDDTFDFKTCQRSDGTMYGVPESSSCAQKGAKEVQKSERNQSSRGGGYGGRHSSEIKTPTARERDPINYNPQMDKFGSRTTRTRSGRTSYRHPGSPAIDKPSKSSSRSSKPYTQIQDHESSPEAAASKNYWGPKTSTRSSARSTPSSSSSKPAPRSSASRSVRSPEEELRKFNQLRAQQYGTEKATRNRQRRQRVGAALRKFGQELQRQNMQRINQSIEDNKRYSIKRDAFGGYTIGEDMFGNIRRRNKYGF